MSAPTPLAEITATAIRVLCREMGAVNTARFLNQFWTGLGNYTEDRDRIVGEPTVDELVTEIQARRDSKKTKAKKSPVKRPGRTKS